jgi:hypothetical protein
VLPASAAKNDAGGSGSGAETVPSPHAISQGGGGLAVFGLSNEAAGSPEAERLDDLVHGRNEGLADRRACPFKGHLLRPVQEGAQGAAGHVILLGRLAEVLNYFDLKNSPDR